MERAILKRLFYSFHMKGGEGGGGDVKGVEGAGSEAPLDGRREETGAGAAGGAVGAEEGSGPGWKAGEEDPVHKVSVMMAERRAVAELLVAGKEGRLEVALGLVARQAAQRNVTAGDVVREFRDAKGRTALHLAAAEGHVALVEALAEVGRGWDMVWVCGEGVEVVGPSAKEGGLAAEGEDK